MNVYLNGFDRKEVTFKANTTTQEGGTANIISKTSIGTAPLDTNFSGVCSCIRDGYASLVIRGYVTVSYTGTAPQTGYTKLTADGKGGVQVSDNGRYILVTDVDKTALTCGIVL